MRAEHGRIERRSVQANDDAVIESVAPTRFVDAGPLCSDRMAKHITKRKETDMFDQLLIVAGLLAGIAALFMYARTIDPVSGQRIANRRE